MTLTRRRLLVGVATLGLAVVSAEVVARVVLGLGDPPLYIAHPTIEYMLKPNQDVKRFGNRILVNDHGMRSENFSTADDENNSSRILVFGDSVVNGGSLTDHQDLATSMVSKELNHLDNRKYIVGNVSAGSWGIINIYSFLKIFGFFGADIVFFVFNGQDIFDCPTYAPLNPNTRPTERPRSAVAEGINRYLIPYLQRQRKANDNEKVIADPLACEVLSSHALDDMLKKSKQNVRNTLILYHPTLNEINTGVHEIGFEKIRAIAERNEVAFVDLTPRIRSKIADGNVLYRDSIHLNDAGQAFYARVLLEYVSPLFP